MFNLSYSSPEYDIFFITWWYLLKLFPSLSYASTANKQKFASYVYLYTLLFYAYLSVCFFCIQVNLCHKSLNVVTADQMKSHITHFMNNDDKCLKYNCQFSSHQIRGKSSAHDHYLLYVPS